MPMVLIQRSFQSKRPNPMSSSDSSAGSSFLSSLGASAAAPPPPAAAAAGAAAPPPEGTEASFLDPSAINSSTLLSLSSEMTLSSFSFSTSMPTEEMIAEMSSAEGEALPPKHGQKVSSHVTHD